MGMGKERYITSVSFLLATLLFTNHYFKGFSYFQAEKRLCGTVSADKNEILFKEFNMNYNNEPEIFKRGTLLLRKTISNEETASRKVIVDVHDDMLKAAFWKDHSSLLAEKYFKQNLVYDGPITDIVSEQIHDKKTIRDQ